MRARRRSPFALLALTLSVVGTQPAVAQDRDGDGAPSDADEFPCDPSIAGAFFAPGEGQRGALLFEDQWPDLGDADFNDAVIGYNYRLDVDAAGRVDRIVATFDVLALGGDFDNALGLHLPVPAAGATVIRTIGGGAPQALSTSAADAELTTIIAPDLRALFGGQAGPINAISGPSVPPVTITVTIRLGQPVAPNIVGEAPFDVFLARSADLGHEIHRSAYAGTAAMRGGLFGTGADRSRPGQHFVDGRGLPFVLHLPVLDRWPEEARDIALVFPSVLGFAASGGTSNQDFYLNGFDAAQAYAGQPAVAPAALAPMSVDLSCIDLTLIDRASQLGGFFGAAVAVEGTLAVVAERFGRIFFYGQGPGGRWTEIQRLQLPLLSNSEVGSVALSAGRVAVGEPSGTQGTGLGRVEILERTNGSWAVTDTLVGPGGQSGFGRRVALSPSTLLVGEFSTGVAYAFERSGGGWGSPQRLAPPPAAPAGRFGWSVAVDGDVAVVGQPRSGAGRAHVFTRAPGQPWQHQTQLDEDAAGHPADFGAAVAVSDGQVAVGSAQDGELGPSAGAVYLYGDANGRWQRTQKLLPQGPVRAGAYFGYSVDIEGLMLVVGAFGARHTALEGGALFTYRRAGGRWHRLQTHVLQRPNDFTRLGLAVAVHGETILGSANGVSGPPHGEVFFFGVHVCSPGACDDGNPCTVDTCDPVSGCVNVPNDAVCDDGLFCNGVETCSSTQGCLPGAPPACLDDGIACTVDVCDEAIDSCTHTPLDAICDDGQFCNGAEVCSPSGGCQPGRVMSCDDGNACTTDRCDEVVQSCIHVPAGC